MDRDLKFFELFCGSGKLTRAFRSHGYKSSQYDLNLDPSENFGTTPLVLIELHWLHDHTYYYIAIPRLGFTIAVQKLLRVLAGGLFWSGLPCSSFIFMSQGSSGRHKSNPSGNNSLLTRTGNKLCCRWTLLVMLAIARGVYWVCEQPSSSFAPKMEYVKWILHVNRINIALPAGRIVQLHSGCSPLFELLPKSLNPRP